MVPANILLGIFLTSTATLVLEIALTRLLSVAQWHHFAFMVVSIALMGYGASGSLLFAFADIFRRGESPNLFLASWFFSLSTLLAYVFGNRLPFDIARISWDRWQLLYIFFFYLIYAVPFFFSGLTLSLALTRWSAFSGKLYSFDLIGGAAGCLLVLVLFGLFGGTGTLLVSSLLSSLAAWAFGWRKKPFSWLHWSWTAVPIFLLFWQPAFLNLAISPYKSLSAALMYPGARLLETRWNAFSRVDILESPAVRTAPGLSLQYLDPLPRQMGLTVDADRMNAITNAQDNLQDQEAMRFLSALPSSFPYQVLKPERVLVFDPMGGLEVLNAIYHRTKETTVLETNPIIVELLREKYSLFSGRIYNRKDVQISIGDGRSFLRGKPGSFDLIILPLTETMGASASVLSSIREDYRLTVEAFEDYLKALSPQGWIAFHLYLLPPPRGEFRLVAILLEAFKRLGKSPGNHFFAFRSWGTFSLFMKKDVILPAEIESLKEFCKQWRFDPVYYPGMPIEEANRFNRFPSPIYFTGIQNLLEQGKDFSSRYAFDLSPATDDRPFFHHFFRWGHLGEIYRLAGEKWQILIEGGYFIPLVFLQALFLSFIFIVLPVMIRKDRASILQSRRIIWLIFFFNLGLGFMFVEIALIQKFILFLGHPVYAVSWVILSLLVFAGVGSRISSAIRTAQGLKWSLLLIAGFLLLYAVFLAPVLSFFQGHSFLCRQGLAVLFIAPLGLVMGIPFPLGIRLCDVQNPGFVPWAWCANACASVLGAILPVIMALGWGFQVVFLFASLLYLLAPFLVWRSVVS